LPAISVRLPHREHVTAAPATPTARTARHSTPSVKRPPASAAQLTGGPVTATPPTPPSPSGRTPPRAAT
jgi:hypothetical protein